MLAICSGGLGEAPWGRHQPGAGCAGRQATD